MFVGLARFEIHIPESSSLKDKRSIIKSMIKRTEKRLNVSISEVEYHDLWQRSAIGAAVVGESEATVKRGLDLIGAELERDYGAEITSVEKKVISFDDL